jgi:hypothetical protein
MGKRMPARATPPTRVRRVSGAATNCTRRVLSGTNTGEHTATQWFPEWQQRKRYIAFRANQSVTFDIGN